jgi:hypothetical protein
MSTKTYEARGEMTPEQMRKSAEPWNAVIKERIRRYFRKNNNNPATVMQLTRGVGFVHPAWRYNDGEIVTRLGLESGGAFLTYFSLKEEEEEEAAS